MLFYIDTSIYLNLWQNEKPFCIYAKHFFEKYTNSTFFYSGFILKELCHILSEEKFKQKQILFKNTPDFKKLMLTSEEFNEARKIESEVNYEISFFDIIHILLARKVNSILIIRDKKMLELAVKYGVNSGKPEEFL